MLKIGNSPFAWLHFDETGALVDPGSQAALDAIVAAEGVTDLVVLSHGWQNDLSDAFTLYTTLWGNVSASLQAADRDPATFAVAGVLWPAKKWDADYDGADAMMGAGGAGGAKSLDDGAMPDDLDAAAFEAGLARLDGFLDPAAVAEVSAAARRAADNAADAAAFDFFKVARGALGFHTSMEVSPGANTSAGPPPPDAELQQDAGLFRRADTIDGADQLLNDFSMPFAIDVAPGTGSAQGLGDIVRGVFQGGRSGVLWALNKLTYYTMKNRAGVVGAALAEGVLAKLAPPRALRLHLVGHSFGGRLVTAAANALPAIPDVEFRSLTLLQAAYSHNGMVKGTGPFAAVIGKPSGAIAFTHTHNDRACTVAYPLASRITGDTAKSLGDSDDPFGAMGANGPQKLDSSLLATSVAPGFAMQAGKINLVLADAFVVKTDASDAHNNVTNVGCGAVVASVLTT